MNQDNTAGGDAASTLSITKAATHFSAPAGYLSACTMGLPTRETLAALRADLDSWERAETSAASYGDLVQESRELYAKIVGTTASNVATGSQTSTLVGTVASNVPDGAKILCVDGDFSSVAHPFVQQAHRGVTVRYAPADQLAEHITPDTHMVTFSLVQSATGSIARSADIVAAAQRNNALTLCDLTQATGWLPVNADDFDLTVCHTYKWLCIPRGVAFMTVSPELQQRYHAPNAGWYSSENVWGACYAPTMPLASDARRFDVSPAWQAWVGAREALSFFASLDMDEVRDHNVALGNELCRGLGITEANQAIVAWPDADGSRLAALKDAGITASGRAGRVRVAFHLWNTSDDVNAVLAAVLDAVD
ncbi:aminotransferase class V-fold PLP-dependent enzyme [Lysinibacter cavernae]|uniref:Selenocysteine lyase/cysteine desulfurase n=1 Tax=Lysinibacter cavernae TaxID=1640652 RepID=A0A7X5R0J7_9MICO|nr:aminotransferase class V-fold PLP-dependent enzyme [Lysinibacter cavernae]NIH53418.1 selenocysteine lyase/cysteine desulfurase [Lysinibacter cavernae]